MNSLTFFLTSLSAVSVFWGRHYWHSIHLFRLCGWKWREGQALNDTSLWLGTLWSSWRRPNLALWEWGREGEKSHRFPMAERRKKFRHPLTILGEENEAAAYLEWNLARKSEDPSGLWLWILIMQTCRDRTQPADRQTDGRIDLQRSFCHLRNVQGANHATSHRKTMSIFPDLKLNNFR